jgi:GTP1/Obg family GTP-binding protein
MDTLRDLKRDLSNIKKDLREIKSITLDMQHRDVDRWSQVDKLMAFLQDLWQAMTDRDKGKSQVRQVYIGPRLGPGF